jgi:hypothetical protein
MRVVEVNGRKRRIYNGKFAKIQVKKRRRIDKRNEISASAATTTNSGDEKLFSWREGRRVVELGYLAEQLQKGCKECEEGLALNNIVEETKQGLGSILYIQCDCGELNSVRTGKTHRDPNKKKVGRPIWDVNTKAATG